MTAGVGAWLPGLAWLPPVLREPAYWRLVGRFALVGPLIGGLPYAWLIVTLPFVYAFGLAPAVLAGALYAAWWLTPGRRRPGIASSLAVGAICGASGCAAVALAWEPAQPLGPLLFLGLHGVPAAIAVALLSRATPQRSLGSTSPWRTAQRTSAGTSESPSFAISRLR